jgi:hypothetical protein
MTFRTRRFASTSVLTMILVAAALAPVVTRAVDLSQEFATDDKAFSIRYPADWKIITKEQNDKVQREAGPLMAKLKVDLNRMTFVVADPAPAALPPNVNLVITPGRLPLDKPDLAKAKMRETLDQLAAATGARMSDVNIAVEQLAGHDVLISSYRTTGPGAALRQTQVMFPGRTQTYIVTCSALAADYPRVEPTFKAMLDSVKVASGGFGAWPLWAQYAAIGGIGGAAAGAVAWIAMRFGKRASKPR